MPAMEPEVEAFTETMTQVTGLVKLKPMILNPDKVAPNDSILLKASLILHLCFYVWLFFIDFFSL